MRIRPRYIAYETLALNDNAVEYCEIIPLPVNELLKKQRDSNVGSSKEGPLINPLEFIDTLVPPFYCYLRSIPIEPVVQAFTSVVENATVDSFIRNQLSIIQKNCDTREQIHEKNITSSQDLILGFSEKLEKDAIAARRLAEEHLPIFLKHVQTMPVRKNVIIKHGNWTLSLNLIPAYRNKFKFAHKDDGDEYCNWEKMDGWNETNAIHECSNQLLRNIHTLQNLEQATHTTHRPENNEFDQWLMKRKSRWHLERECRKSMRIVEDNQTWNQIDEIHANNPSSMKRILNDNDIYIRVDPKLPMPEVKEKETDESIQTSTVWKFGTFTSLQNHGSFQSLRSRNIGISQIKNSKVTNTPNITKNLDQSKFLHLLGSTMRDYFQEHSILFQNEEDCQNDATSNHLKRNEIEIEHPLSYICTGLPLPGYKKDPTDSRPKLAALSSLSAVSLSDLYCSGEKASRLSKRRRRDHREPRKLEDAEKILPGTNVSHLLSISNIIAPLRVKHGIFLPHSSKLDLRPKVQLQNNISFLTSVQNFTARVGEGLRPSFRNVRHNGTILKPARVLNESSNWLAKTKTASMNMLSFFSPEFNVTRDNLHTTKPNSIFSFEESDALLSTSIATRGELLHLSKKSIDISMESAPTSSLDLVSMDLNENEGPSESLSKNAQNEQRQLSSKDTISEVSTALNEKKNDRRCRKRRERSEAKKLKKEQKRQDKKRKRERRAKRKSRKRKNYPMDANSDRGSKDNSARSVNVPDVPCIAVPSLYVGATPMIMTRKVQTVTEEVAIGAGKIMKRKRNAEYESKTQQNISSWQLNVKDSNCATIMTPKEDSLDEGEGIFIKSTSHNDASQLQDSFRSTCNTVNVNTLVIKDVLGSSIGVEASGERHELALNMMSEADSQERRKAIDASSIYFQQGEFSMPNMKIPPPGHAKDIETKRTHGAQIQLDAMNIPTSKYRHNYGDNSDRNLGFLTNKEINQIPREALLKDQELQVDSRLVGEEEDDERHQLPSMLPIPVLCSERFLEQSSQASSELSSGRWVNAMAAANDDCQLSQTEKDFQEKFDLHDCSLVDDCGIDIELADRIAIKIMSLVSMSVIDCKGFTKEVVQLASSGRYNIIYLLIVVDAFESSYNLDSLTLLQNALVKQTGCPCQQISFQYLVPSTLSPTIAQLILCHQPPSKFITLALESKMVERAAFLLTISPSMTIFECFILLSGNRMIPFGQILANFSKASEPFKTTGIDKSSSRQIQSCLLSHVQSFGAF